MGLKKALCVGLNYPDSKHQIYGCVNDCLNWDALLKESFGFDETRVLIDQHPDGSRSTAPTQIPTRDNILAQLSWLCSTAEPGDCLAFVFAGHGCQVRSSGTGEIDQALVPDDFGRLDEYGNPRLVMEDELHALFRKLPAGSMITIILDCCHGSSMLDVPCCADSSSNPPIISLTCERPRINQQHGTWESWQQMIIPHAYGRPRFIPMVTSNGSGWPRRTAVGTGAHLGRMNLNPGVTAFCFSASRPTETGLDASIKSHQQGVMSYCLQEALAQLRNRCTYADLLQKAAVKLEDIRLKYMPMMDQHIQLSFCPNSPPTEVVVFDKAYATVAQHVLYKRAKEQEQGLNAPKVGGDMRAAPNREASSDFVPSPQYQMNNHQPQQREMPASPANRSRNHNAPQTPYGAGIEVGKVYVRVRRAHNLKNTDSGLMGDVSDPYCVIRLGKMEKKTPTINNNLNPEWTSSNDFAFPVTESDHILEFLVMNANFVKDDLLGKTSADLRDCPPGKWHQVRCRLQDQGEIEYDIRFEGQLAPALAGSGHADTYRFNSMGAADPYHVDPYRSNQVGGTSLASGNNTNMFGTPNLFGEVPNLLAGLQSAQRSVSVNCGSSRPLSLQGVAGTPLPLEPTRAPNIGNTFALPPAAPMSSPYQALGVTMPSAVGRQGMSAAGPLYGQIGQPMPYPGLPVASCSAARPAQGAWKY